MPAFASHVRTATEVERRRAQAAELNPQAGANLKRADRLRQAILKRAFEGKLVPQDPTDQPAGAVLERIRVERARIPDGGSPNLRLSPPAPPRGRTRVVSSPERRPSA